MTDRKVRRTQSAPHLTPMERRCFQMAVVEGTLFIRRRQAHSLENGFIAEEEEREVEKGREGPGSRPGSVSSLASEDSSVVMANGGRESNRRIRILTNPHGKLRIMKIIHYILCEYDNLWNNILSKMILSKKQQQVTTLSAHHFQTHKRESTVL